MGKKIKPPPHTELYEDRQSFERFERLAKGLMAVPKKELDKQLTKHEHDKSSKPRRRKT